MRRFLSCTRLSCTLMMAATALASRPAAATPLVVSFTATVLFVGAPLAGVFTVGDSVTGSFHVDPLGDSDPDPATGIYPAGDVSFSSGSYSLTSPGCSPFPPVGCDIHVYDDRPDNGTHDWITGAIAVMGTPIGMNMPLAFIFEVFDSDASALSSDAMPTSILLDDFDADRRSVQLLFFSGFVFAALSSVAITVPEPAAVVLSIFGAACAALSLRNRSQTLRTHAPDRPPAT